MDNLDKYGIGVAVLVTAAAYIMLPPFFKSRKFNRWTDLSRNKQLIFHGFPRGRFTPHGSPFVLKLETYLKMTKIPYSFDHTEPFGPTGKTPWISYNGENVGDSQIVIDYLNKKFQKNLNGSYSQEKLAIAHAIRILCEEHLFWGIRYWIFVQDGRYLLPKHFKAPKFQLEMLKFFYGRQIKKDTWAQGLTRHSNEQIEAMMMKDLRTISAILGKNKFIIGDEPCEDDAAIFGNLAGFVWGIQSESNYGKLVKEELTNIIGYCERMKEKFWPDWNECLDP